MFRFSWLLAATVGMTFVPSLQADPPDAKRPADGPPAKYARVTDGPHKVRESEVAIPGERWQKEMKVRVRFPEDGGPYPLVVFCAGSGGGNDTFAPTSKYLAGHGFVVLHTSYPFKARGGSNAELTENRVLDVKLALDSLAEIEKQVPELKGKIDVKNIGAMGHSSGAYITQLVGGATVVFGKEEKSFRDGRVKAIIQYSGQGSDQQGLTKDSWKKVTIPMLTMTGTKDRGATGGGPEWKKEPYNLSPAGGKYHLCYEGGHHGSFSGKFAQKDIFAHAQIMTLAFWDAHLNSNKEARAFLESDTPKKVNEAKLEYSHRTGRVAEPGAAPDPALKAGPGR